MGLIGAEVDEGLSPGMGSPKTALELADWRRQVAELYAAVRAAASPVEGHALWREGRDQLFKNHPQTPLPDGSPLRVTGLPYWPYNPALRFELPIAPGKPAPTRSLAGGADGDVGLHGLGTIQLPYPLDATIEVWWLDQYAGGIFLPVRDGTSGTTSYGGGRYLLDTAKGADLGGGLGTITIDLNFLYHPSCRYSSKWECPLAPAENTVQVPLNAGERL